MTDADKLADAQPALEHRMFGSPHLPVPIPRQSADDEPIEPCPPREIALATAWIIAWALAVYILADVIGSI